MFSMHRDNLLTLAAHLDALPTDYAGFDMRDYARTADEDYHFIRLTHLATTDCGTVCCAVGHGPAAGFAPLPDERNWSDYCERVFGAKPMSHEWEWMFGVAWARADNTPQGAAKRIRYFLANGVPAALYDLRRADLVPLYADA
jgi:hypothetical protein